MSNEVSNEIENADQRATILLVDDKPEKLLALRSVLEELGTNLVCAQSGREALRLLLKEDFALILLDVSMPDIDGFETASLIRQRKRTEYTPIIFITSINTNETHVTRGYELGAVDYIFSPIQSDILKAKVGVFIELYNKNLEVKRQAELLQQQAERRASSLENRLEVLLNKLGVGVYKASLDGELLEVNAPFLEILGFKDLEDAKASRFHPEYSENFFEESEQWHDQEWVREDGKKIWVSMTQSIFVDEDGQQSIQGLVDDITRRKSDELQLKTLNDSLEQKVVERTEALKISQQLARRSERLASLGTLAAGIAHEINNPLNSILMSSDFALKRIQNQEIVSATLQTIAEETKRCGKIVKGVLQFARDEKKAKQQTDLNMIIQNGVELARTYVKTPLIIDLNLANKSIFAMLNPTEIEQVIINLVQNAVEAVKGHTQIRISTHSLNNYAVVTIQDNGPGIPEEVQMKIFDPFYSTKTEVGGTGLGLSVVHGIITEHGGAIGVRSGMSDGACFEIKFPQIVLPLIDIAEAR